MDCNYWSITDLHVMISFHGRFAADFSTSLSYGDDEKNDYGDSSFILALSKNRNMSRVLFVESLV